MTIAATFAALRAGGEATCTTVEGVEVGGARPGARSEISGEGADGAGARPRARGDAVARR